jgi:hypothetical protein
MTTTCTGKAIDPRSIPFFLRGFNAFHLARPIRRSLDAGFLSQTSPKQRSSPAIRRATDYITHATAKLLVYLSSLLTISRSASRPRLFGK